MPTVETFDDPLTSGTWQSQGNGDPVITWPVSDIPLGSKYVYRNWTNTPGYFNIVEDEGVLPINHYVYKEKFFGPWVGKYKCYGTGNPNSWFSMEGSFNRTNCGQYLGNPLTLPDRDEATYQGLYDTCSNELLSKLKDQDINLPLFYVERKRTMDLILTNLGSLTGFLDGLNKGNLRKAAGSLGITVTSKESGVYRRMYEKNPAKAMASLFLQFQYGWKPLLQDIYGALKFIEKQLKPGQTKPFKVSVTKKEKVKQELFSDQGLGGALQVKQTLRMSYVVKMSVEYQISNSRLHTLASLGITNPGAVAWEALPFSFIADWVLPIGTFISSLDSTIGLEFLRGTVSSKYQCENSAFSHGSAQTTWTYDGSANSFAKSVHVARDPLPSFPAPRLPHFKNPVTPTHIANAIALITVLVGGRTGRTPTFIR